MVVELNHVLQQKGKAMRGASCVCVKGYRNQCLLIHGTYFFSPYNPSALGIKELLLPILVALSQSVGIIMIIIMYPPEEVRSL